VVAAFKWSIEDWHQLVDSGVLENKRVELLEGEIIQMSPESPMHSSTNYSIVEYLKSAFQDRAVIREAHPITLDNSELEPDIAIVSTPYTTYFTRHPYPQDIYWLIEISNKTLLKIDLEQKSKIYARNGIPEYWVIDLINYKVWVHTQPGRDTYLQITEYLSGIISPKTFPDLKISIEQLILFKP
jgi:Uma2 family endonuclease